MTVSLEDNLAGDSRDSEGRAPDELESEPSTKWRDFGIDLCMVGAPIAFSFIYPCPGIPSLLAFVLTFNVIQVFTAGVRFFHDIPKFPKKENTPKPGQTLVDGAGLLLLGVAAWGAAITFPNTEKYFGNGGDGCPIPIFCCAFVSSLIPVVVVACMFLGWVGTQVLNKLKGEAPTAEKKEKGAGGSRMSPMVAMALMLCMTPLPAAEATLSTPKSVSRAAQMAASGVAIPIGGLYASLAWTLLRDLPKDRALDLDLHQRVFRRPFIRDGERVLEVGIGPGLSKNAAYLPPRMELTGIDVNAGASITESTALQNHYTPVVGSGEDMSMFESKQFDTVVCTFALCTIPDPERAVAEVSRVLKRGGHFISIEHVLATPHAQRDGDKEGLLGAMGFGLREQQQLLNPLQQRVAHGCHLDRQTGVLLETLTGKGRLFTECAYQERVDFTTQWPISSQVFTVLKR